MSQNKSYYVYPNESEPSKLKYSLTTNKGKFFGKGSFCGYYGYSGYKNCHVIADIAVPDIYEFGSSNDITKDCASVETCDDVRTIPDYYTSPMIVKASRDSDAVNAAINVIIEYEKRIWEMNKDRVLSNRKKRLQDQPK